MTVLVLIRHAESEMNANGTHLIGGRSNHSPLSEKGASQAHSLGLRLKREAMPIHRWFVSPAVRTRETTRIALSSMEVETDIVIDDRIQELCQGDWEGKLREEFYTPERMTQVDADNWNFKAPNGESQRDVENRMTAFADEIADKHPGETVALVTHGVAIKCLLRGVMDWNPRKTYKTVIQNTSLSVLRHDGQWTLQRLNDHAHLL
jgi:broad specificity phosphatase PhoE